MLAQMGKLLLFIGLGLVVIGAMIMLFGRFAPDGRLLPGDIVIRRPGFELYLPIATMVLVSVVLSFILWILAQIRQ